MQARKRIKILASVAVFAGIMAAFAAWQGGLQRLFHLPGKPASVSSATTYDEFQKAQDLLLRSYKNANIAEAIKGFQAVLQADPSFAMAEARLGNAYFIQYRNSHDPNLLDLAKAATDRAMNLDPRLAPPYVTLSRIAAMQGNTALAMEQVQKASISTHAAPKPTGRWVKCMKRKESKVTQLPHIRRRSILRRTTGAGPCEWA